MTHARAFESSSHSQHKIHFQTICKLAKDEQVDQLRIYLIRNKISAYMVPYANETPAKALLEEMCTGAAGILQKNFSMTETEASFSSLAEMWEVKIPDNNGDTFSSANGAWEKRLIYMGVDIAALKENILAENYSATSEILQVYPEAIGFSAAFAAYHRQLNMLSKLMVSMDETFYENRKLYPRIYDNLLKKIIANAALGNHFDKRYNLFDFLIHLREDGLRRIFFNYLSSINKKYTLSYYDRSMIDRLVKLYYQNHFSNLNSRFPEDVTAQILFEQDKDRLTVALKLYLYLSSSHYLFFYRQQKKINNFTQTFMEKLPQCTTVDKLKNAIQVHQKLLERLNINKNNYPDYWEIMMQMDKNLVSPVKKELDSPVLTI